MRYSMHELNGSDACARRRSFHYEFKGKSEDYYKKAGIIKKAVRDGLSGALKEEDIEKEIESEFEDLGYVSPEQRKLQAEDAARQVRRYISSETRKPVYAPASDVKIGENDTGEDILVHVSPDAVFKKTVPAIVAFRGTSVVSSTETVQEIEVVRIKCRKPSGKLDKQANVFQNLEMYALLKYGRLMAPAGKRCKITASIYFLRKMNDRSSADNPAFDMNFFNTKGAGNIISLTEDYTKPVSSSVGEDPIVTEMDLAYKPIVEHYAAGIPETECTEADCKVCPLDKICHFTDPPARLVVKKEAKGVSAARFTPAQREAKEYEHGICRINAGAGAGKTFTVAHRVVALLNKGVKPEAIFITTFTNAGAQELRERIRAYAEDDGIVDDVDIDKIRIQTFNAFGDDIIHEEYARFGFDEAPKLIDDVERYKIVSDLLKDTDIEGLNYKDFEANNYQCKGAVIMGAKVFDILKRNRDLTLKDRDQIYENLGADKRFCTPESIDALYRIYRDYDNRLRDEGLIEFSDQENLVFELLDQEPYYFEKFGFQHIIIDEFQDTSMAQINIIKKLTECPSFESLMVVGDDSQGIYSFRGTTPEYIINFDTVMGTKIDDIQLLENHRSTPEILDFANEINRMNVNRLPKDLIATRPHGKEVVVKGFFKPADELQYIVEGIKEHIADGVKPEDIAVIARNKAELNAVADALSEAGIASVIQFPEKYVDNSRVQAAIAFMNAARDEEDSKDLLIYANALAGGDLIHATEDEIAKAVENAKERIQAYRAVTIPEEELEKLGEILQEIDPPTAEYPEGLDSVYGAFRKSLLARPAQKVGEYCDSFAKFGDDAAIRRDGSYPGVVLSTAHSSKGLEWPIVYNMISKYDKEELHGRGAKSDRVEEERRLLFVSSTRARDELYVTGQYIAFGKAGHYTPNQFLINAFNASGDPITVEDVLVKKAKEQLKEAERRQLEKEKRKFEKKQKKETVITA